MSSILGGASGGSASGVAFGTSPLDFQPTDRERALREWLLKDVLGTHAYKDFATWLGDKLVINGLEIPISQILGFIGFTFITPSVVLTGETRSLTSYGDLATVGPTLSGLSDGQYAVFFGAQILTPTSPSAEIGIVSVSVNGAAASDDDTINASAGGSTGVNISTSRVLVKTLTNGNNSLQLKYRTSLGGTVTFYRRWLTAVRFANP